MMMTTVELTDAGTAAFNTWFELTAKDRTRRETVTCELLEILAKRVESGDALTFELGGQHTASGRPETLTLAANDIEVTDND